MKKNFAMGLDDKRQVAQYLLSVQKHISGTAFWIINMSEWDKHFIEIPISKLKNPMLINADGILLFLKEEIEKFFGEKDIVEIQYGRPEERSLNSIALSNLLDFDS